MTQVATIEKLLDATHAQISVPRKSACGHDCEECAGCGVSGISVLTTAENRIGATVGEKVVVESSTQKLLGIVILVYLVPLVLFLLGYFLTPAFSEGLRYAIAGAGFALGLLLAVFYDRHLHRAGGLTFTIVRPF